MVISVNYMYYKDEIFVTFSVGNAMTDKTGVFQGFLCKKKEKKDSIKLQIIIC